MRWLQQCSIFGLTSLISTVLFMFKQSDPTLLLPYWLVWLFTYIFFIFWFYNIISQIRQRRLALSRQRKEAPIPQIKIVLHITGAVCLSVFFGLLTAVEMGVYIDIRVELIPLYVLFSVLTLSPFIAKALDRQSSTLDTTYTTHKLFSPQEDEGY